MDSTGWEAARTPPAAEGPPLSTVAWGGLAAKGGHVLPPRGQRCGFQAADHKAEGSSPSGPDLDLAEERGVVVEHRVRTQLTQQRRVSHPTSRRGDMGRPERASDLDPHRVPVPPVPLVKSVTERLAAW